MLDAKQGILNYTGGRINRDDIAEDHCRDRVSSPRRMARSTVAESAARTLDDLAGVLRREASGPTLIRSTRRCSLPCSG